MSPQHIHENMKEILADDAPSQATVYRQIDELKRCRQSAKDGHGFGRPVEACSDERVKSVQDMILKDRRLTTRHVAECLKLPTGTTHHIISEILGYNKACTLWMLRMLTSEI